MQIMQLSGMQLSGIDCIVNYDQSINDISNQCIKSMCNDNMDLMHNLYFNAMKNTKTHQYQLDHCKRCHPSKWPQSWQLRNKNTKTHQYQLDCIHFRVYL